MILPSGNTYDIFYSGLTNVINRFVYSLNSSPKIIFVGAIFALISDFTWQLFSMILHCVVSYLERLQFFSTGLNTICGNEA